MLLNECYSRQDFQNKNALRYDMTTFYSTVTVLTKCQYISGDVKKTRGWVMNVWALRSYRKISFYWWNRMIGQDVVVGKC